MRFTGTQRIRVKVVTSKLILGSASVFGDLCNSFLIVLINVCAVNKICVRATFAWNINRWCMAVSYSSCIHTYGASTAAHDGRIHSYSVVNSIIIQLVQTPNVELALLLQHLPRRRPTHCTSYMLDICIVYVLQKANKLCNMMLLLLVRWVRRPVLSVCSKCV